MAKPLYVQKKVSTEEMKAQKPIQNDFKYIRETSLQEMVLDSNDPEQRIIKKVFARENL